MDSGGRSTPAPGHPAAAVEDRAPADPVRLGYQPALDGLRGLALLAIVVFHSRVEGVPGAFLSVSTFFTLSGFLITTVVLAEHDRSGRIGIGGFYGRRARRLLPAALVAVALIVLAAALLGNATQLARLRADALSSLFYVGNWHQVAAGDSYGAIFESPSPFTHFWTLAIEEQFYLLFPLVVVGALWATRRSRAGLAIVFAAIAAASVGWSAYLLATGASVDRVYFGTDTRIAELLVGGLLAIWVSRRPLRSPRVQGAVAWLGAGALLVMLAAWHVADRTAPAFYQGGLVLYAGLTALVILAAVQPRGPVRAALGWRPLVALGVISYGAYLLHWPILVWLQLHSPLPDAAQLAVGLALTVGAATLLYRYVEQPIRTGTTFVSRAPLIATGTACGVVLLVLAVTVLRPATTTVFDFEAASAAVNGDPPVTAAGSGPDALAGLSADERAQVARWLEVEAAVGRSTAPRTAIFGDSTALMTGLGMTNWSRVHLDQLAPADGDAEIGCGLLTGVERRGGKADGPVPASCTGYLDRWILAVTNQHVDIALVQLGPWDVHDVRLTPDGPWLTPGVDAPLDDLLRTRLDEAVTALLDRVDLVVILTSPDVTFNRADGVDPPRAEPASDPARMRRFREIQSEVAAAHPGRVDTIDLGGWLAARPDERELRPDGVHLTQDASMTLSDWLGPEVVRRHATHAARTADPGR